MASMFFNAYAFNMDIGNWNVGNVTYMTDMFYNARSFNQDLSGWCVSEIGSPPDFFDSGTTMWTLGNSRPVWGTCP